MYFVINLLAILMGSGLAFCLLIKEKVPKKRALAFVAMLALMVFFFGLDPRIEEGPLLELGFSAIRGIIGAACAMLIVLKCYAKDFSKIFRAITVSLPLMYAISKLSCLYIGCCHGFVYNGPFAYVHNGESFFPIQLVEIISFTLMTIAFWLVLKKKRQAIVWLPSIALGAKFLLDFCRYARNGIGLLSWNQIFLLFIMIAWLDFATKHKKLLLNSKTLQPR